MLLPSFVLFVQMNACVQPTSLSVTRVRVRVLTAVSVATGSVMERMTVHMERMSATVTVSVAGNTLITPLTA